MLDLTTGASIQQVLGYIALLVLGFFGPRIMEFVNASKLKPSPSPEQPEDEPAFEVLTAAEVHRRRLERLGDSDLNTASAAEEDRELRNGDGAAERCMDEMDAQREIYAEGDDDKNAAENAAADICWKQRRDINAFLHRSASQLKIGKVEGNQMSMPGTQCVSTQLRSPDGTGLDFILRPMDFRGDL